MTSPFFIFIPVPFPHESPQRESYPLAPIAEKGIPEKDPPLLKPFNKPIPVPPLMRLPVWLMPDRVLP